VPNAVRRRDGGGPPFDLAGGVRTPIVAAM
jgi:hypothetical protein